jgi:pro-sigmaK processing inhibitor BofA
VGSSDRRCAAKGDEGVLALIINAILGVILLFLTNLIIEPNIPINIVTVLIVAIFGVVGWALLLILHLLGVAF